MVTKENKELIAKIGNLERTLKRTQINLDTARAGWKEAEHKVERLTAENERFRADIEELLRLSVRIEGNKIDRCKCYITRAIHRYAEHLCQTLLFDYHKIEKKYTEVKE